MIIAAISIDPAWLIVTVGSLVATAVGASWYLGRTISQNTAEVRKLAAELGSVKGDVDGARIARGKLHDENRELRERVVKIETRLEIQRENAARVGRTTAERTEAG